MKLKRLTERIWYYPYEEERDRPNLGYIRGDRWSLAVDAGHSDAHLAEFYRALEEAGLPLPQLTVLTHWHWDHTFALHAIHGISLANAQTNRHLREIRDRIGQNGPEEFLALDESIRREYAGNRPVKVIPADLEFTGEMMLDAGNCPIRVFQAAAPHTEDSTLVEVSGEKVLFIGDATCGTFPAWEKDPVLTRKLAETVRASRAEICLEGHWIPCPKEDTIEDLLGEVCAENSERNMPGGVIRAAAADAETVAALACELWPEHTPAEMAAEYQDLLADDDAAVFLYRKNGEPAGFAQCQLRRDYVEGTETSPVGYLEGIFVREDDRRQGIARGLLSACEAWAKEKGCREFASDCELTNAESQAFHQAAGFREANRIVAYVKPLREGR